MDSYYDSAEDTTITRKRADREIEAHGFDRKDAEWLEFADTIAWPAQAQLVLDWLGY
jgi:hypothetical protein